MVGETHSTTSGQLYFVSPYHRGHPTVDKCIWTIGVHEEIETFDVAIQNAWKADDIAWGVRHYSKNSFSEIGINYGKELLFIAKFVFNQGVWHGYPADVNKRPNDRPKPNILSDWISRDIISKPFRSRIQGGKL